MKQSAKAKWQGPLKEGKGHLKTESGSLNTSYTYKMRFEEQRGTNPEELLAAAQAACFSMALAAELQKVNLVADSIEVEGSAKLEKIADSWEIGGIHLDVAASIPGASLPQFESAIEATKRNCLVSKALKIPIEVESKLMSLLEAG